MYRYIYLYHLTALLEYHIISKISDNQIYNRLQEAKNRFIRGFTHFQT